MVRSHNKVEKMDFEQALDRLEKIVTEMQEGKLGLEDMVARFEEGMKLVDFCRKKLDEVKFRIDELTQKNGEETSEEYKSESGDPF